MTQGPKKYSPFRRRQRRLLLLGIVLPAFTIATGLALAALTRTQVYAYGPSGLPPFEEIEGKKIRLSGLVAPDTLKPGTDALVEFTVTDGVNKVPVHFNDALPSLVAEGDGVVAEGHLGADGIFTATRIMARHDENYIAPEVADALKESGEYEKFITDRRQ